jgi:hypothetical protein
MRVAKAAAPVRMLKNRIRAHRRPTEVGRRSPVKAALAMPLQAVGGDAAGGDRACRPSAAFQPQ